MDRVGEEMAKVELQQGHLKHLHVRKEVPTRHHYEKSAQPC